METQSRLEPCPGNSVIPRRYAQAKQALHRFRDEERGSMLIFGLFCFIMMLYLTGVAIDLMRFEQNRTKIQNTADRAALAAADLRQTLPPKDVVRDYFIKEGLTPPDYDEIDVQQGNFNEWRTVRVNVNDTMPTWFLTLYNINYLSTPANSIAEERIGNVEISLVLDVSGSMNSNNRLINLKPAARDFVDTMFDAVQAGRLSMNIITYSTQTNAGPDLTKYFRMTAEQQKSNCIDFPASDYTTTALRPKTTAQGMPESPSDRQYQRTAHFEPFNTIAAPISGGTSDWTAASATECKVGTDRYIKAYSGDRNALKTYINNLTADGNTSIEIGVKWGAALLDPSMNPVVQGLIGEGKVNAGFADRPFAFNDREALKVLVVMSDGENTSEYRVLPNYASGVSRLRGNTAYAENDLAGYSLYDPATNKYWIITKGLWRTEPWGDGTYKPCGSCAYTADPGDSYAMTWQDVWRRMSANYFADKIISPAYGTTERAKWRTSAATGIDTESIDAADKDTRTANICTASKNNGVQIYSIGFEASSHGISTLRSCATKPANFYSVAGLNISTAFASIASSINKLRLTQ